MNQHNNSLFEFCLLLDYHEDSGENKNVMKIN